MRAARIFGGTGRVHPPDGSVRSRAAENEDRRRAWQHLYTQSSQGSPAGIPYTLALRDTITGALIIEHIGLVLPQPPPPDHVVRFTPVVTTHAPSRELLLPSSTDHDKFKIFEITISTHKRYESAHSTIIYLQQAARYSEGVCRNEAAFSIYQSTV